MVVGGVVTAGGFVVTMARGDDADPVALTSEPGVTVDGTMSGGAGSGSSPEGAMPAPLDLGTAVLGVPVLAPTYLPEGVVGWRDDALRVWDASGANETVEGYVRYYGSDTATVTLTVRASAEDPVEVGQRLFGPSEVVAVQGRPASMSVIDLGDDGLLVNLYFSPVDGVLCLLETNGLDLGEVLTVAESITATT